MRISPACLHPICKVLYLNQSIKCNVRAIEIKPRITNVTKQNKRQFITKNHTELHQLIHRVTREKSFIYMCEVEAQKLMWRHLFTILIVNFCQRKSMAEICMEHLFEKQQLQQQQQQQQRMRPSFVKTVISPTATPWEEGDCVAVISLENKNFKKVFDERFQNPLPYCAITITAQFLMFLMKGNKIISCWFLLFIIWFTALAISLTVFTLLFIWLW